MSDDLSILERMIEISTVEMRTNQQVRQVKEKKNNLQKLYIPIILH
jgi:hypothetical protein